MSINRRDFIKLGLFGLVVGAGEVLRQKMPIIRKIWDEQGSMITGKVEDLELITSEVPKSLEGAQIPTENEWFREADSVLSAGIALYEEWRANNPKLPELYYHKPENYLNIPSMAHKIDEKVHEYPEQLKSGYEGIVGYLIDAADEYDIPYSSIFKGSGSGIDSLQQMIAIDPGTGLVRGIRESMKEKFGNDFDIYSACRYGPLTDEQRKFFGDAFSSWYFDAMEFVSNVRKNSSEQISTNILFSYFLHKNKGDILASAWDTSTWLKILVRNDPKNDLKRDPNYERAKLATDLFKDEFSPTISANWVVENVNKDDKLLNYVQDPYAHFQFKDYMPPNRAGGYYHAWNIMALCMCMSPFLAKRMVAINTNPSLDDDGNRWTEYGRDKSKADMVLLIELMK